MTELMENPTRLVLTFGGTSIAAPEGWQTIADLLRERRAEGARLLVVVPDVTDALVELAEGAGLAVRRLDTRELLEARPDGGRAHATRGGRADAARGGRAEAARRLSAECSSEPDPALRERLDGLDAIGLADGLVARGPDGETGVPDRDGSGTAAACLAARWGADRLEIWSDVPGMFSADPRKVPTARLLRQLTYAEAQEIATTGSSVVHPRTIRALRDRGIPIHLASIRDPAAPGTLIGPRASEDDALLKAVSWKTGVVLVSMETLGMWQEVGFLARAFGVFGDAGLSIDLVSTSETSVTVTLDAGTDLLEPGVLDEVTERLSSFCRVEVVQPCAAVSLVGSRIRGLLHSLAPAFEAFEEHRIHMVSQAANDLNFTVVVDEEEGDRLGRQLHRTLVAEPGLPEVFGPSWDELVHEERPERPRAWWERERSALLERFGEVEAAYVYHLDTAREQIRRLREVGSVSRVLYSVKANPAPDLLRAVHEEGAGFECVSRGEVEHVLGLLPELSPETILFTPNFAARHEYAFALDRGVRVTLDALHPLVHWPELFRGRDLFLRLDPGRGASGHHEKVTTAGLRSKFGIPVEELDDLTARLEAAGARVTGLHAHAGSGITTHEHWARMAHFLLPVAGRFPDVRVLDLGGGLPVPHRAGEAALDLAALSEGLAHVAAARPDLEIWLEPGRFVVGECGVLLARVTQTKRKGGLRYVGVATGMNSLIRPTLYGAYHQIVNLTRLDEPPGERVQVVGPICESGDRLGMDRVLPSTQEGDLLLIATTGAYGRAMASSYNLRPPAPEFVLG